MLFCACTILLAGTHCPRVVPAAVTVAATDPCVGSAALSNNESQQEEDAELRGMRIQLFKNADVDGSGELSMQESKDLILTLEAIGQNDAELTQLMAGADVNHDGKIDYAEFVPLAVDLVGGLCAKLDVAASQLDAQERRSAPASPPTSTCCTA